MSAIPYTSLGKKIRNSIADIMEASGRGHISSAFSMVEILLVLYERILKYDAKNPTWSERDRFILSKGHGCLGLYPILAAKDFFPQSELLKFCSIEGILGGHPDHLKVPGIEASTGALGHGLSIGLGMAMAAKMDKKNYRAFVLLGDGECNEGSIWEAAMHASKHKLSNLVALVDYNKFQSYGSTKEILDLEPFNEKWKAFGFEAYEVDGRDPLAMEKLMLELDYTNGKPKAIICHTIKGQGISFIEGDLSWHHKSKLLPEELKALRDALKE